MSQLRSKPVDKQRPPGRDVPAQPAVDIRHQGTRSRARPSAEAGPSGPEGSAETQSATDSQSYLQWAGFMIGPRNGDFGFGAYFAGEEPIGAYTWTPSRRG
jgi:hypothetical protein